MIYTDPPKDFYPKFEIGSNVVIHNNKILFLKRLSNKSEGNKWGIPAGKLEKNEDIQLGTIRELFEETGIMVSTDEHKKILTLYDRYPDFDFTFHIFVCEVKNNDVKISPTEHSEFKWTNLNDALKLELMTDVDKILEYTSKIIKVGDI